MCFPFGMACGSVADPPTAHGTTRGRRTSSGNLSPVSKRAHSIVYGLPLSRDGTGSDLDIFIDPQNQQER